MRARLWLLLHALVVVIPTIAAIAHAPDVRLFGSEVPPALPSPSFEGWWHEKVQPAFQGWFEANIGFRGVMVRTDNTVQATLLRDKPGTTVVIGNDGTLFYIDDVALMGTRPQELKTSLGRIDVLLRALGSVNRKLVARGKRLVVVIAPSKTVVYPEEVPARWRRSDGHRGDVEVHAALRAGLEREAIPFSDADALLSGKHGEERQLVFGATGRHWTELGACLVLRDALPEGPTRPSCAYEMRPADRDLDPDFDLYTLQNLWRFERSASLHPVLIDAPPASAPSAAGAPRPRTLFVGTSFTWMLANVMRTLVDNPIALFYNTTFYDVSDVTRKPLATVDPATPEWARYVLDRDLYVVELLETYAHGEHMITFVQTLDRRLDSPE